MSKTTIECIRCGTCCKIYYFNYEPTKVGREYLQAHYGRKVTKLEFEVPHRCAQLEGNNHCKIYENRPKWCREFQCTEDARKRAVKGIKEASND